MSRDHQYKNVSVQSGAGSQTKRVFRKNMGKSSPRHDSQSETVKSRPKMAGAREGYFSRCSLLKSLLRGQN